MLTLVPHPETPCDALDAIEVDLQSSRSGLRLHYYLRGDLDRIVIPAPKPSQRRHELWKSTCLEAFVKGDSGPAYCEFNFAPDRAWAAYAFKDRREGMHDTPARVEIHIGRHPGLFELTAHLQADFSPDARLGLSAVIEERDGRISYWALCHPSDRPDFHDPAGFVHRLGTP
ncbi:DOMON-like domain-containing protein [Sphingomicrobium nitratireducens]|uniref:DOMON-like domain-containing protein n=1 Tax=Sphingomicrobium nitratireducens TaxID=2964666 RepID=UPI00223EA2CF|nr:DOMON-like domain-containing protein [Sphingomicrobium nitratireducens]